MALAGCMETLGLLLPEPLIESLGAALPVECNYVLSFALFVRLRHPQVAEHRAGLITLPGATRERLQAVCEVLAELLPCELIGSLRATLPGPLSVAFGCADCRCAA
jgi:hypothetical protein